MEVKFQASTKFTAAAALTAAREGTTTKAVMERWLTTLAYAEEPENVDPVDRQVSFTMHLAVGPDAFPEDVFVDLCTFADAMGVTPSKLATGIVKQALTEGWMDDPEFWKRHTTAWPKRIDQLIQPALASVSAGLLSPSRRHDRRVNLALHRSLTFWFGLLIMGFVCWAWCDSQDNLTRGMGGAWLAQSRNSAIVIDHDKRRSGHWKLSREPYAHGETMISDHWATPKLISGGEQDPDEAWFTRYDELNSLRRQLEIEMETAPANHKLILIPYWLILLTVAAVWLGLLFWRARRRRKAVTLA